MAQLVGRARELGHLKKTLESVLSGKGATVLIGGEAGIGKTRLAEECISLAASQGFKLMRGWCMQSSFAPYVPMREALKGIGAEHLLAGDVSPPRLEGSFLVSKGGILLAKRERSASAMDSDIFTGMLTAVTQFIKDSVSQMGMVTEGNVSSIRYGNSSILAIPGKGAYLASVVTGKENEFLVDDMGDVLAEIEERFGGLIDGWKGETKEFVEAEGIIGRLFDSEKYEGIDWAKDDPKARQGNVFENVTLGLVRITKARPLLLFIDDLQWADASTLAMLHYLSRNTRGSRMLILGTYRTEDIALGIEGKPHRLVETMQTMNREMLFEKVELKNLKGDEVAELVRADLGAMEQEDDLVRALTKESEGNPLYVIELVNLLKEEGALVERDRRWSLARSIENVGVPSRVHDVIARRLARLIKEQRQVLESASVIGEVFSSDVLGDVAGVKKLDLLRMLGEIENAHRLIASSERNYRFSHVKVREVLYNGISKELKRELHRQVGDALHGLHGESDEAVSDIGYHYYKAGDPEKAVPRLMRASEMAKERYANDEAMTYCRYLLELMETGRWEAERIKVLECLGDIEEVTGDYDGAVISYGQVMMTSDDIETRVRMHRKTGAVLIKKGEYEDAIAELKKGKMMLMGMRMPEIGRLDIVLGIVYENKGEYDPAIACREAALRTLDALEGTKKDKAEAMIGMGLTYTHKGEFDKALSYYERGRELLEEIGDQRNIALLLNNIGILYDEKGEYDKALEYYERSLKIRQRLGDQHGIAGSLNNMGIVFREKGNDERALTFYQKSLKIMEKLGDQHRAGMLLSNIGTVLKSRGEYDDAQKRYEKSLEVCERLGDKRGIAAGLYNLGNLSFEKGDYDEAVRLYECASDIVVSIGNKVLQIDFMLGLGEALLRKDRLDEAEAQASRALELSKENDIKIKDGIALKLLGMVAYARKDLEGARKRFEDSISILLPVDSWEDMADVYFEYARVLRAMGESGAAKDALQKALDSYKKIKNARKAGMAQKELDGL